MEKTIGLEGLPAISVYQIGDVYFVLDGNHRVSVAQQLGASHIQAYVTEVKSRVPLTPDIQPDQLIIKAEQVNFLEHTRIDQIRPDADLTVTIPGQYPILEEHISVHRYFMGIDQGQEIPYEAAVAHWYDEVYLPIVDTICERGILKNFQNRTVTDLYLWISRHRADLERFLGWHVGTEAVVEDLVSSHAQDFNKIVARIADRILDVVTPDPLESGPPVGYWREEHRGTPEQEDLFKDILVALDKDFDHWFAFDQAVIIAKRDRSNLLGLHILPGTGSNSESEVKTLSAEYTRRCKNADVTGELAFEIGGVARVICERAQWADLIISRLVHPPGDNILNRFESGFRTMIRRCSRPILAVPGNITNLDQALLAFNDSPKALEALYVGAYMAGKWGTHLTVLSIDQEGVRAKSLQKHARQYLTTKNIPADYIRHEIGQSAEIILQTSQVQKCDVILMGGYKASPIIEVVFGSIVDQVLRKTDIPVLICR
jgi:nucleotide-binding universal stress UspA family protein